METIKELFFPEKIDYYKIKREIDENHDRLVEEFAERNRQYERRRKEQIKCIEWSRICGNIVIHYMSKLTDNVVKEYLLSCELTAYLPIEVRECIKEEFEIDFKDGYLLYKRHQLLFGKMFNILK